MKISPARLAMAIGTWSAAGGPLYQGLADGLRGAMERGELPAGTVLPPERDLAERLHVSRTTVVGAYRALKAAGLLDSRQGRGTWVLGPSAPGPSDLPFSGELYAGMMGGAGDLIELSAAAPLPTAVVTEELARIAGDLAGRVSGSGYLPSGLPELRERSEAGVADLAAQDQPDQTVQAG